MLPCRPVSTAIGKLVLANRWPLDDPNPRRRLYTDARDISHTGADIVGYQGQQPEPILLDFPLDRWLDK